MTKDFKYTIIRSDGKEMVTQEVTFGSKEKPFPDDWKNIPSVQVSLYEHGNKLLNEHYKVKIEEVKKTK